MSYVESGAEEMVKLSELGDHGVVQHPEHVLVAQGAVATPAEDAAQSLLLLGELPHAQVLCRAVFTLRYVNTTLHCTSSNVWHVLAEAQCFHRSVSMGNTAEACTGDSLLYGLQQAGSLVLDDVFQ